MKTRVQVTANAFFTLSFVVIFLLSAGCFYPKAERVSGELVSEVDYKIIDETTVVDSGEIARQWIYVDCEYWAGCFMRCDGKSNQCKQLAKDSKLSILSVFMSVFE